MMPSGGDGGGY
jgi:hypothetical protein